MAVFREKTFEVLTKDIDNGRINSNPSFIIIPSGQIIVFYSKYMTSGRTSDSRVTFVSGFTIQVDAGAGTLNSNAVTWNAATIALPPSSYVLVYVDVSGNVVTTTSWSMDVVKTSIVLAYVNVGDSVVVYIEEVEKAGNYIFVRKQVPVVGGWVWDDNEYILNTGEQPRAAYDVSMGKVYVSYRKDSTAFMRLFDVSDDTTWHYIRNYSVTASTININANPQVIFNFRGGAGNKAVGTMANPDLFPISVVGFGFILESGSPVPYIFIGPLTANSYTPYIITDVTFNIYTTYGNSGYVLEDSFSTPYPFRNDFTLWHRWTGTSGIKYIGISVGTHLFVQPFVTDPAYYSSVTVVSDYEVRSLVSDTVNSLLADRVYALTPGAGHLGTVVKTYEYDAEFNFQIDNMSLITGAGNIGTVVKTSEYEAVFNFQTDSMSLITGAGNQALITNIVYH